MKFYLFGNAFLVWIFLTMFSSCSVNYIADLNGNQPELLKKKNDVRIISGVNVNFTNRPVGGELNLSYAVSSHWFLTSGFKAGGFIFPSGYGYGTDFRSFTAGAGYFNTNLNGNYTQVGLRYVRGDELLYEVDGTNYYWSHLHKSQLYNGVDFSFSSAFATNSGKWGFTMRLTNLVTIQHNPLNRFGFFINYSTKPKNHMMLSVCTGFSSDLSKDAKSRNMSFVIFRPTFIYLLNTTRKKKINLLDQ